MQGRGSKGKGKEVEELYRTDGREENILNESLRRLLCAHTTRKDVNWGNG